MKKRILFFMSDTGGGHRASANAIAEAIHHLYPDTYETIIEDIWKKYILWPINKLPDTYSWLSGPGQPVWKLLWQASKTGRGQDLFFSLVAPIISHRAINYLRAIQPDLIISVHPLMNHLGLEWIERAGIQVPFVTVVTDMVTLHPTWVCPEVTRCIVPTDPAYRNALHFGMPPEKLTIHGQPVALKFTQLTGEKIALRQKLGLRTDKRTILLVSGGEGTGRVYEIAREIAQSVTNAQLMIVTGRNHKLQLRLQAVQWEIPTKIFGFVSNMPELMGAADILITKAGPGTISEAFIAGLPPLISGYIPGQEAGNVVYVQENGAGTYAEAPQDIASIVGEWLDPANQVLQQMANNATRLARPNASLDIAADVCSLLI